MNDEGAFWDSSSLVPLCLFEQSTSLARAFLKQWRPTVWWATPVEISGAIARRVRERRLNESQVDGALEALDALAGHWEMVRPADTLRESAQRLVRRHDLRAADALQLAAAIQWRGAGTERIVFISGDMRLLTAAQASGFQVMSTAK